MRFLKIIALSLVVGGCSKPPDLETPCPEYGRYCSQSLINVDSMGE